MNIDEAKAVLSLAEKFELQDHTFGDAEVHWKIDDDIIAEGYFGRVDADLDLHVSIKQSRNSWSSQKFTGDEARELRKCFAKQTIERNDGGS